MIKNDYLEKLIEQVSDVIRTVTGLKGKTAFKDAHESIKEALKQFFGLNPKSIETLQPKSLIDIVTGADKNNNEKALLLGELIKEQGDLYKEEENEKEALSTYIKSITILSEVMIEDDTVREERYMHKLDEIEEILSNYHLPMDTTLLLIKYYEVIGAFDKSEDLLYDILEDSNYNKNVVSIGLDFYNRLLKLDDEILENGNLPRNEVEDGLEGLLESVK
ncbi:DUF6483 family protein [uncultured Clostridium sp.]|mgnify:CR=1 FL=1|uniref:DUF6483 family protein n=1 Tax=uncultured Clostridium sp. TaxID=59620 RepID=UPI0025FA0A9A|nr:DUF6483 family protein [uncultured Clostridium sp.]